MDRLIYTAMTGAKATMGQQAAVANNLANVATTGFRAEVHRLRAVPVVSESLPSKAFVVDASIGADYSTGAVSQTGRELDAAINGKVEAADWGEAMAQLIADVRDGRPGDGIVAAVTMAGDLLEMHFPRSHDDQNEMPDRLIEL